MNYQEDIKPISYVKSKASQVLEKINENRRPLIITQNGEARGILIDPDSYQKMKDAIGILKLVSESEQSIQKGQSIKNEEVFNQLEKKLKNGFKS